MNAAQHLLQIQQHPWAPVRGLNMKTNTLVVIILAVLVLIAVMQTAQLFSLKNKLDSGELSVKEITQEAKLESQKTANIIETVPEKADNQKEVL